MVTSPSPVTLYTPSTRNGGLLTTFVTLSPWQPSARSGIERAISLDRYRITANTSYGSRRFFACRTGPNRKRYATRRAIGRVAAIDFGVVGCGFVGEGAAGCFHVGYREHCGGTETSPKTPKGRPPIWTAQRALRTYFRKKTEVGTYRTRLGGGGLLPTIRYTRVSLSRWSLLSSEIATGRPISLAARTKRAANSGISFLLWTLIVMPFGASGKVSTMGCVPHPTSPKMSANCSANAALSRSPNWFHISKKPMWMGLSDEIRCSLCSGVRTR